MLPLTKAISEATNALEICNACRYCEGFCAVFPAMELKTMFETQDIGYLANLCHGCKGCFHACQFAPPHEFGINLPKNFAEIRLETYAEYAWPRSLGKSFAKNGTLVAFVTSLVLATTLLLTSLFSKEVFTVHIGAGAFYKVLSWGLMASLAGATFIFAVLAIFMSAKNFWQAIKPATPVTFKAIVAAAQDALTLKNLGGGGDGCNDVDESFSKQRKTYHHFLMYGFGLCFASTSVATIYDHFLQFQAPYAFFSLPVILGTVGGIGMVIGCCGLTYIKFITDPAPTSAKVLGADYALLVLLNLVAITGLLLLAMRETGLMGSLLALHLGLILGLFLLLPYSKFVHGIYRALALLKNKIEETS